MCVCGGGGGASRKRSQKSILVGLRCTLTRIKMEEGDFLGGKNGHVPC